MKFLKLYVCLGLSMTVAAYGQTSNLGSGDTKAIFAKMAPEKVAELSLRSFTGTCKSTKIMGGASAYILKYKDGSTNIVKRFGLIPKQITPLNEILPANSSISNFLKQVEYKRPSRLDLFLSELKSNLLISDAHAIAAANLTLPSYSIPLHSFEFLKSSKSQLGNFIKGLIAQDKCGTVIFEKFSQNISNMRSDVTFYKDGAAIRCSAAGFQKNIRNAQTCTTQIVRTELPAKACMAFYRQFSQLNGRNAGTQASTSSSSSTSSTSTASSSSTAVGLPVFAQLTDAIREEFAISAAIKAQPELEFSLNSADIAQADHMVEVEAIQVIEQKPISAASFTNGSLSQADIQHLANLQATHQAIKQDSSYVQFSSEVQSVLNNSAIKTALESYVSSHSIAPQVFSIPKATAIEQHIGDELQPIKAIWGPAKPIRFNLGCISEMIQIEKMAPSQMNMLQMQ